MSEERKLSKIHIGAGRRLNIKVILDDDKVIYEGKTEDAPDDIKKMHYSKIDVGKIITYYVYSN